MTVSQHKIQPVKAHFSIGIMYYVVADQAMSCLTILSNLSVANMPECVKYDEEGTLRRGSENVLQRIRKVTIFFFAH